MVSRSALGWLRGMSWIACCWAGVSGVSLSRPMASRSRLWLALMVGGIRSLRT
ncbi:hypothetical protein [Streptosporangium sp. NPDC050280]|uniref:hypothetical protein n=1 Tax=unclassified Streptosporangium TaxID=2632669 RepID=UPI003416DED5